MKGAEPREAGRAQEGPGAGCAESPRAAGEVLWGVSKRSHWFSQTLLPKVQAGTEIIVEPPLDDWGHTFLSRLHGYSVCQRKESWRRESNGSASDCRGLAPAASQQGQRDADRAILGAGWRRQAC